MNDQKIHFSSELLYKGVAMILTACWSMHAVAVTPLTKERPVRSKKYVTYVQKIEQLQSQLPLEIAAVERTLAIPDEDLKTRMFNPKKNSLIEPLQLTVSPVDEKILALAAKISKPGKKLALAHYLRENLSQGEAVPGTDLRLVSVTPATMDMINRDELDQMFAKDHFELSISTKGLQKNASLRGKLVSQLSPYLTQSQINAVRKKISKGETLNVDSDLLPKFAKDMIKRHTIFKGPNCFHAALSFQSPLLSNSPKVNVREEPGYSRDMLNYDELWRAVQLDFYEVNPAKVELKYGDMILFFDTPKSPKTTVDFRTLRHAATYLVGGYAFAKGSKSANSPYIIRPLADEWSTWTRYTENLGVKVFRRNLKHVKNAALWDPQDWMH